MRVLVSVPMVCRSVVLSRRLRQSSVVLYLMIVYWRRLHIEIYSGWRWVLICIDERHQGRHNFASHCQSLHNLQQKQPSQNAVIWFPRELSEVVVEGEIMARVATVSTPSRRLVA